MQFFVFLSSQTTGKYWRCRFNNFNYQAMTDEFTKKIVQVFYKLSKRNFSLLLVLSPESGNHQHLFDRFQQNFSADGVNILFTNLFRVMRSIDHFTCKFL